LKNKTILITGGTGSLGQELTRQILQQDPKKVIIYSRGEFLQVEMRRKFNDSRIRFFIGDVRDCSRLKIALTGVEFILHVAALKGVDTCAYNPFEAIQTNVIGAQNVIEAAIARKVEKVVVISSDKASNPINLYGATKLCADKLFIASNAYSGKDGTVFAVVRFGNFIDSNGSVLPYWKALLTNGETILPITDPEMTRFYIDIETAAKFVLKALAEAKQGETWCPKMDSYSILELARSISSTAKIEYIGKRPGEKKHEAMIVADDADRTYEFSDRFITLPEFDWMQSEIPKDGKAVSSRFQYRSGGEYEKVI